jgi:hypothetical protein
LLSKSRRRAPERRRIISRMKPEDTKIRYRYATSALLGPWRDTEDDACDDAIRVGLASRVDGKLVWRVAGRIEPQEMPDLLPIWNLPARKR